MEEVWLMAGDAEHVFLLRVGWPGQLQARGWAPAAHTLPPSSTHPSAPHQHHTHCHCHYPCR